MLIWPAEVQHIVLVALGQNSWQLNKRQIRIIGNPLMSKGLIRILSARQGTDLVAAVQLKVRSIRVKLAAQKIGKRDAQVRCAGVYGNAANSYCPRSWYKRFLMYKNIPRAPFL